MDKEKSMCDLGPLIEEIIKENRKVRITVTGCSMQPLIENKKDAVYLEKCTCPQKYDIILYRRNSGAYVLHRVLGVKKGEFVLAGDAEYEKEYGIKPEQVIAKVIRIYKANGRVIHCSSRKYKMLSILWAKFFPLRKLILGLREAQ